MTTRKPKKRQRVRNARVRRSTSYEYDFSISFAGANYDQAVELYFALAAFGASVYIYLHHQDNLIGRNLRVEFRRIFTEETRFFIPLVSHDYATRKWTKFEYGVAIEERKLRSKDYILPVILDDSRLRSMPSHIGHEDLRKISHEEAARRLTIRLQDVYPQRAKRVVEKVWVACFGLQVEDAVDEGYIPEEIPRKYWACCDWLEEDLATKLRHSPVGRFEHTEASARDGEGLSVRIGFEWNPKLGPMNFGDIRPWEILEIAPFRRIYRRGSSNFLRRLRSRDKVYSHAQSH